MELTMKKYIGINIVLFILWSIILGFIFFWGGSGFATLDDKIYLNFGLIIIYSFKLFANYLALKKVYSSIILIVSNILIIYFMNKNIYISNIVNVLLIFEILFSQTFINLIFIKELRKKAIINFIIYNIIILIIIFINKKMNYNKISYEISFLSNIYFMLILIIPLLYQKILEYKYVRCIAGNIDIKNKINNLSTYVFINIFNGIIYFFIFLLLFISLEKEKEKVIFSVIIFFTLITILKEIIILKNFKKSKNYFIQKISVYFLMILGMNFNYEGFQFLVYFIYLYSMITIDVNLLKKSKNIIKKNLKIFLLMMILIIFSIIIKKSELIVFSLFLLLLLIFIEKLIEYNAVREIEAKDIY